MITLSQSFLEQVIRDIEAVEDDCSDLLTTRRRGTLIRAANIIRDILHEKQVELESGIGKR